MSITSLKNRINKRVELNKYKTDYYDIGNFIKEKRKELKATQDEISDGICSVSYLSKIENNQIVPSEFYVKEIMEKLDINNAILTKCVEEKKYLRKTVDAFFYLDDNKIRNVFEEIKEIEHNLVINLCKLGYYTYFDEGDNNQYVMMLENLINNMTDFEISVYLYFSSLFFVKNERYKVALELLMLNEKLIHNDYMINAMIAELSYYVKQRLLIKNCSNEDYYKAQTTFNNQHNIKRSVNLALYKAKFLSLEHPEKALLQINTIKTEFLSLDILDLYNYTKASILYSLNQINKATIYLNHIKDDSKYYLRKMILLYKICIDSKDIEMMKSIELILSEYKPKSCEMISKVYYHFLTQDNEQDKKEYLRDIAIPFSIKVDDYNKLKEYTDHVMEICINNSRYKEATQFYKKYQKEMSKVKRLLY